MISGVKAVGFIFGGGLAFYLVLFLICLPIMANASKNSMLHAMSNNVYGTLYMPVRDLLPHGSAVRETIHDYERWACAGSSGCVLN